MQSNGNSQTQGVLCGLGAALIWGAWPVVSRLGLDGALSAYDVAALRFGVAGLILAPLVLRGGVFRGVNWRRALILACGAGVPYVVLTVEGLHYAPAGHAGVIVPSCMLTFTALGAWLFLGDRPNAMRVLGMAAILLGLALVGWSAFSATSPRAGAWRGDLMFIGSGFLWACYTLGARAWSLKPMQATALVSVLSMLLYLPPYLVVAGPRLLDAPLQSVLVQALFQGVFAAVLALLLYTRAVASLGAARGALFAALVPGVAVLLAFPLLGERPSLTEAAGLLVVTLGMTAALGVLRFPKLSFGETGVRAAARLCRDRREA